MRKMKAVAGSVAGMVATTFALSSCTYVVSSDTNDLESKIEALTARVAQLESGDTAVTLARLRSELAAHEQQIRQLGERRVAPANPQPSRPPVQVASRRAAPTAHGRPEARRTPGGDDRHARRAQMIGKRAGLDEGQTAELARIFKTQQERMALATKSTRDQKMTREQAAEYRKKAKQQNDALLAEFKARLNEEQARKLEEALKPRWRPDAGPGRERQVRRDRDANRDREAKRERARPEREKRQKQNKDRQKKRDAGAPADPEY